MNVIRRVSFYCRNSVLKRLWLSKKIETHHSERQLSPFKEFQMLCAQQEENSLWFSHRFISHIVYSLSSCSRLETCSPGTFLRNYSGYNNNNNNNKCNVSHPSPFKTTYVYHTHTYTHMHVQYTNTHTRSGSL